MNRFVCMHGHLYQPLRENPRIEGVKLQDFACPHHDWNERVAAERYEPDALSRILVADKRVIGIVNNYARMGRATDRALRQHRRLFNMHNGHENT